MFVCTIRRCEVWIRVGGFSCKCGTKVYGMQRVESGMGEWALKAVEAKLDAMSECGCGELQFLIRQISILQEPFSTAPHTPYSEEYRRPALG